MFFPRPRSVVFFLLVCLAGAGLAFADGEDKMTEEQMRQFLLTADVINSKQISKGITAPWKLTLREKGGTFTHDAAFQSVEERKASMQFATGRTELNFRDSYHFNIAAFELSKLVGLGYMMPVTVERKWQGKSGSLSWWVHWKWDEGMRLKDKIQPPDADAWNKQMWRMRVFSQLVYDTDRNLGNVLISEDWKLYMIDFTRAFRLYDTLENPANLTRCPRELLDHLRKLDAAEAEQKTKGHLSRSELKGVMARRDKILAHFEKLVAQKGESEVLY